jgi:hypothetical protein
MDDHPGRQPSSFGPAEPAKSSLAAAALDRDGLVMGLTSTAADPARLIQ